MPSISLQPLKVDGGKSMFKQLFNFCRAIRLLVGQKARFTDQRGQQVEFT
jgi:hypothetical protein